MTLKSEEMAQMRHKAYCLSFVASATFFMATSASGQILSDTSAVRRINEGIGYMYNHVFGKAHEVYEKTESMYPGHPINHLLRGILMYNEYYPLLPTSPQHQVFEEEMRQCIDESAQKPYAEEYEAESLLANMCARGLLLTFYAENGLSMNVIPLATSTYKFLIRSFDFVSVFADFYFFTGLYNYYWEAYPRIHPIYKPLASLFPPGDMAIGLNQINIASQQSIFLKAEAYSILAWIYTEFENNSMQSAIYSGTLSEIYPKNHIFKASHIKNLLLLKDYDQAENIIEGTLQGIVNDYFSAQLLIFNGIIQEKKYQNYTLARQYYEQGIEALSLYGDLGDEYCGYAYFGLSRISEYSGDKIGRKAYRRKGDDLVNFKKINFD